MNGYTGSPETILDEPEVVEDKVVLGWVEADTEAGTPAGWVVYRDTVVTQVHRTTTRLVSDRRAASYAEALASAKADHQLPTYLRSDDRDRAEQELADAADEQAVVSAVQSQDAQAEASRRRAARG